jgi:tRNA 2-thiocytidine biosynthesis protein TtcA
MEKYKEIERSIITTYRKTIWKPFVAAVKEYELIKEGDKIAVCMSGGKDSMLMAKCMQELKLHGKNNFELVFLVMDPGYNEWNRQAIENNAKLLNIPINIFSTNIFDYVAGLKEGSPCYLCARMRRGHLYSKAKELGCNKIALGHHFNDVIETTLMSMLYNGQFKTMMPKLYSDNFEGLELIRPLYKVKENAIINWKNYNELQFINCACRFTETCVINDTGGSKRKEMKRLVKTLEGMNPVFSDNIFKSLYNVNLSTVLGTIKNGKKSFFLENYEPAEVVDTEEE